MALPGPDAHVGARRRARPRLPLLDLAAVQAHEERRRLRGAPVHDGETEHGALELCPKFAAFACLIFTNYVSRVKYI